MTSPPSNYSRLAGVYCNSACKNSEEMAQSTIKWYYRIISVLQSWELHVEEGALNLTT
jgi:hypothetical protein